MATHINKEITYSSELGDFYLAKIYNYTINAKSFIILIDPNTYEGYICESKKENVHAYCQISSIKIYN